jgi:mannose-1-phosphate guanylyltransferase/mannose-6-phosphate isomerase
MLEKSGLILPVVLAGGSGIRLWPLSRKNRPKQFLSLVNNHSLLQMTLELIKAIPNVSSPLIVANEAHRFIIKEQAKNIINELTILLEVKSHSTALATALAVLWAMRKTTDPLFLVLSADQFISDTAEFAAMITSAIEIALQSKLVVFGVPPLSAETNYGYIERGKPLSEAEGSGYHVKKFIEKPPLKAALSYIRSKKYYWNSGIFLFQASTFLKELQQYAPEVFTAAQKMMNKLFMESNFVSFHHHEEALADFSNPSIDKTVFEHTKRAVVFPFRGGWHDLGDWNSLYQMGKKDKNANVISKHVLTFDTKNCYLHSDKMLLVTAGLENCLVIATNDVLLVARRDKKQDIKKIVDYLIHAKHREATEGSIIYQSWGHYEIVETANNLKISYYTIMPGHAALIQNQGSSHWILAKGTALAILENEDQLLSTNECLFVDKAISFHIENRDKALINLIQIQTS